MLLLLAVVIIAFLAQRYVLEHALDGVTYTLKTSPVLVDPDVPFEIITTLENHKKWIPVLLQIQELLPDCITILGDQKDRFHSINKTLFHDYSQYLTRKGKATRVFHATLPKRGRFIFPGANISANDFFGISESTTLMEAYVEVVVIPAPWNSTKLNDALGGFLGDLSVQRYIMEDPVLTIGFREYTGREPMRAISWSQTAKGRGLLVKQYDYTTEATVTVILSVDGGTSEQIESCFSITRTVCEQLERQKIRYDFLTNATSAGALGLWRSVPEGLGTQHLNTILEGMGRATHDRTESLHSTLNRAYTQSNTNSSHILILPSENQESRRYTAQFSAMKSGSIQIFTPQEVSP